MNFGDELLARVTKQTNQNDGQDWGPNTDQIPDIGTRVTLRLRPADPGNKSKPQSRPDDSDPIPTDTILPQPVSSP